MTLGTVLLAILAPALLGVIPVWAHSSKWGHGPSGDIGMVLFIVAILLLLTTVELS